MADSLLGGDSYSRVGRLVILALGACVTQVARLFMRCAKRDTLERLKPNIGQMGPNRQSSAICRLAEGTQPNDTIELTLPFTDDDDGSRPGPILPLMAF